MPADVCILCGHAADFDVDRGFGGCIGCAARAARLIAADARLLEQVWSENARSGLPIAEEIFAHFKEGLSRVVEPDDAEVHHDLGIAYVEMGLLRDAVLEFATVLAVDPAAHGLRSSAARHLLTAPLLRKRALAKLRTALFPA